MITQNYARSSGILISDNYLSGGGCTINLSEKGRGPIRATVVGNRFGPSRYAGCAVIAPDSSASCGQHVADNASSRPAAPRSCPTRRRPRHRPPGAGAIDVRGPDRRPPRRPDRGQPLDHGDDLAPVALRREHHGGRETASSAALPASAG